MIPPRRKKSTGYKSGYCGTGWHARCAGEYGTETRRAVCGCACHK